MLPAAILAASLGATGDACALELSADSLVAELHNVHLSGQAELRCGETTLSADEVFLYLNDRQEFAGAVAAGRALLTEGKVAARCEALWLGPDRVRARLDSARLRILGDDGRSVQVDADMERVAQKTWTAEDVALTLCDCATPDWTLRASHIELVEHDRAWLYGPRLTLGKAGVPVTPPLLPLSIPLRARAAGFLAPRIAFLGGGLPTMDLPLFLPLGSSWDLTLSPGLRSDWPSSDHGTLGQLGARRGSARLRYAPALGVSGSMEATWTHDPSLHLLTTRQLDATSEERAAGALAERVGLTWQQSIEGRSGHWNSRVDWVSDDLYQSDFQMSLEERADAYLPSRTQVSWHAGPVAVVAEAAHLLDLRSSTRSNVWGQEQTTPHVGPLVDLRLIPTPLTDHVLARAGARFLRQGPWIEAGQVSAVSFGSVLYADRLFGVLLHAEPRVLAGVLGKASWYAGALNARAQLPLARSFGALRHELAPTVALALVTGGPGETRLDEWVAPERVSQAEVGLRQELRWQGRALGALELRQGVALLHGGLLPLRASASLALGSQGTVDTLLFYDTQQRAFLDLALRLSLGSTLGALNIQYIRFDEGSPRLHPSPYLLAGSSQGPSAGRLVHALSGSVSVPISTFALRYQTAYLFGETGGSFNEHRLGTTLTTDCDCWGLVLTAVIPGEGTWAERTRDLKVHVAFELAGQTIAAN